jgi:hypothetical protein
MFWPASRYFFEATKCIEWTKKDCHAERSEASYSTSFFAMYIAEDSSLCSE